MEKEEDLEDAVGQAQLRLVLWLGLESDAARWSENIPDGQVAVYAETVSRTQCADYPSHDTSQSHNPSLAFSMNTRPVSWGSGAPLHWLSRTSQTPKER